MRTAHPLAAGATSIALAVALGLGATSVVNVNAAETAGTTGAAGTAGAGEPAGFRSSELRAGHHESTATYVDDKSVAGKLENQIGTIGWAGGRLFAPNRAATTTTNHNATDATFTQTDPRAQATMQRTYRFDGNKLTVTTRLRNEADTTRQLALRLYNWAQPVNAKLTSAADSATQLRGAGSANSSYQIDVEMPGVTTRATAATPGELAAWNRPSEITTQGAVLSGTWIDDVAPGQELVATMTITISTQPGALDSDGDGLLDIWETQGATVNGTWMPLHRWGADPMKKDIFLQLNWMKSEWETKDCQAAARFSVDPTGFQRYDECSKLNTNVYRPSGLILQQLVDKFAENGYNLHIDAGKGYSKNFHAADGDYQGGPTLDYQQYFFPSAEGAAAGAHLIRTSFDLLKGRDAIFRAGIIGDLMDAPNEQGAINYATGRGLIGGPGFYVSKNARMGAEDKVRNTIMHELGHNLGLNHNGVVYIDGVRQPANDWTRYGDWLDNRPSVMNYAYQFTTFDFTANTTSGTQVEEHPNCAGEANCYTGPWTVPSEWDNLHVKPGGIKDADVTPGDTGTGDGGEDAVHQHSPHEKDARLLDAAAAKDNNGKADFYMADTNSIATARNNNVVVGTVGNRGTTEHEFTIRTYYGRELRPAPEQKVKLAGIGNKQITDASSLTEIRIPITDTSSLSGSHVPVFIEILNESGESVFEELFDITLLDYTEEELIRVSRELTDPALRAHALSIISNGNSPLYATPKEIESGRNQQLQGNVPSATPTTVVRTEVTTAPSAPASPTTTEPTTSDKAPASSTSAAPEAEQTNIALIVIGVLLGLVGIGAAVGGAVMGMGGGLPF